jgi:protein pelota
MIDTNPEKAYYGFGHVFAADQELAVETLMVTDDLFRSSDVVKRKKYVQLVESVKDHGGTVYIFSTLHVSGQQLKQVSGVAAILRFALHLDNVEQEANNAHSEDDAHIEYDGDNHDVSEDDNSLKKEGTESARLRQDLQDMGL